jgi:hypothetical protein
MPITTVLDDLEAIQPASWPPPLEPEASKAREGPLRGPFSSFGKENCSFALAIF